MNTKNDYRILTADKRIKYAGTDHPSWLTLDQAKSKADIRAGEMVYQFCTETHRPLWEVL
ncbi:MAG: hypothetical protein RIC03_07025 [Cyclobacteriaceae bacterium]